MVSKKKPKKYVRRRTKNSIRKSFSKFIKLLLLLGASALVIYYFIFRSPDKRDRVILTEEAPIRSEYIPEVRDETTAPKTKRSFIDEKLNDIFNDFQLLPTWVSHSGKTINIRVPENFLTITMIQRIINEMEKFDCKIKESSEDIAKKRSVIDIEYKEQLIYRLLFIAEPNLRPVEGKFAIIIDDFGYSSAEEVLRLLRSNYPFTVSILPGLSKSKQLYEEAIKNNKEILVHIPMEAVQEKVDYTEYTIYVNMADDEIRNRVKMAINDYPDCKGINNHMGSRITSDQHIMGIILDEVRNQGRFFIDSKTTDQSIAYEVAKEISVPCLENNLFIEKGRDSSEDYMRKRLLAMSKIAKAQGYALAIGHPYQTTIKVLFEEIPKLKKQGFQLVSVSELFQ